jgi:hemoglobin
MDLLDTHVYGLIGEDGFRRLVAAFYRRVPTDDILSPMYPKEDMAGAEERLRGFLIQRFGGPDLYSQRRGHPRLRMRHGPFKIDRAGRDRWVELMEAALAEAALPTEAIPPLRKFFHDAATFMINHDGG